MTITQLEYLIAVSDCGSFSLASERCFVTQPSLSTQIKNLEEELGVVLLDRTNKPLTLTAIGVVVVEQARRSIASFYELKELVSEQKNEVMGVLRLAVIPTIAPYILHLFVPQFLNKYPKIELDIKEMYTRDIVRELKNGNIDIALLAGGFVDPNEIKEEVLYKDEFYLYVARNSKLKGKKIAEVEDVDLDRLLLLADGHCLRSQILDLCRASRLSGSVLHFESGSLETIVRMVGTTGGMTILPEMATPFVSEANKECLLQFADNLKATRDISLAVSKNFYKKSIYKALKEAIIDMKSKQYYKI